MKTWTLGLLVTLSSLAATTAAQPVCNDEQRQFDFWIGDWTVRDFSSRTIVGRNLVRRVHGCSLEENWVGASGDTGTSLNAYRSSDRKWHQVWVSDAGAFLHLVGEFQDGKMTLLGEAIRPKRGVALLNRVTWSVVNDDPNRVRQFWEVSSDSGSTWTVEFDGLYDRRQP
jgi:hypothetical protein